jgi:hypothetical protein
MFTGQPAVIPAEIRRRGNRFKDHLAGGPPVAHWLPFDDPSRIDVPAARIRERPRSFIPTRHPPERSRRSEIGEGETPLS